MKNNHLFNRKICRIIEKFYSQYLNTNKNLANYSLHLSNSVSIQSYILKGREIKKYLKNNSKILDWGACFGQMSFILEKLGLNVKAYDIAIPEINLFKLIPKEPLQGKAPVSLPFRDKSFDAVLSCGVLEHVPDMEGSLKEISRILKDDSYFFIYNFPYKYSPSEYYATLKKISAHPLKLTIKSLKEILKRNGFNIVKIAYENGIPKNLNSPLKFLRPIYNKFPLFFLNLDKLIIAVPLLRNILSNSIKVIAKK